MRETLSLFAAFLECLWADGQLLALRFDANRFQSN